MNNTTMKNLFQNLIKIILILTVMILIVSCNITGNVTKEELIIGVATPLTGPAASFGNNIKAGVEIALADYDSDIKVIYQDTQCDPKTGLDAVNNLIFRGADAITGIACSSVLLTSSPQGENNKVVLMGATTSNPDITNAGDYIFRVSPTDLVQGKVLANVITEKKIVLLYVKDAYGEGLSKEFKKYKTPIFEGSFTSQETDFKSIITKALSKNPETFVIIAQPSQHPIIASQLRELGFKGQIFADANVAFIENIKAAGDALEGLVFIDTYYDNSDPLTKHLAEEAKKYGVTANGITALGYDGMAVVLEASKGCQDSICIKNNLYKIKDFKGPSGITTFDENGDSSEKEFNLMMVKNGNFVLFNKGE